MKRDKTFGIYVPSYKRYDCIKTDKVLNDCTYVVRESEEQLYRDAGVRKILAAPDQEIDSFQNSSKATAYSLRFVFPDPSGFFSGSGSWLFFFPAL